MRVRVAARWTTAMVAALVLLAAGGCAQPSGRTGMAGESRATLTGAQEVPPVITQASGVSRIMVVGDKTMTGSVETRGIDATAAHVHQAPRGQNGPVIITLAKTGDGVWSVPGNTVLTSAQFDAYRSGELYVNVHSAAHPDGEIRAQLGP